MSDWGMGIDGWDGVGGGGWSDLRDLMGGTTKWVMRSTS